MSLRRGFKAEAERIATEVRAELSLNATSRLDPHLLAKHLGIPVLKIKDCLRVVGNGGCLKHLIHADPDCFSAITVFVGTHRYIVHNEGHALTRQANDIVHEIAHCLLRDAGLSPQRTRGVPGKGNRDAEGTPHKPGQRPAR